MLPPINIECESCAEAPSVLEREVVFQSHMPCFEQVAFGSGIDSYHLAEVIANAGIQSGAAEEACLCSYEKIEFRRQFQRFLKVIF